MSSPLNPYADQHKDPKGPGDARPTAFQILEDNKLIQAWPDKVVLITGASSGIGIETTKAIYATGARVFVMVRDTAKMQPIIDDIIGSTKGSGKIEVIEVDLDSLDSVKNAARRFLSLSSQLNLLINNAGIMACPKTITVDGFERQFAVNYLSHFTLTVLLFPTLRASSNATFNSRIIWVSSAAHRSPASELNLDDIGILDHYEKWAAYGQSKTAMNWASNYIDRTYGAQGVHSLAVHPGGIFTNLGQNLSAEEVEGLAAISDAKKVIKTPAQGAATQVWAATAPVWEGKGGKYLENVQVAGPATDFSTLEGGHGAHVYNPEKEDKLWAISLKLANLENP